MRLPSPALDTVARVDDDNVLEIRNLALSFGGTQALTSVTLDVHRGEVLGLIGPNGAGKTSIFNCINGVYRPDAGDIRFDGRSLVGLKPYQVATLGIARTFQGVELFEDATVLENILLGRHLHMRRGVLAAGVRTPRASREEADQRRRVEEIVKFLEIEDLRHRTASDLPWAQQKLVEIARAMATDPTLLLLDEPSSGMTREEKDDVAHSVRRINKELGVTVVLIEHDVRFISELSTRAVALDFGQIIAAGTPEDVLCSPEVAVSYLGADEATDE